MAEEEKVEKEAKAEQPEQAEKQDKADKQETPKKGGILGKFFKLSNKREKTVFYVACFLALLVLLDRAILIPIIGRLKDLEDRIEQKKMIVTDGLAILGYKELIESEYEEISVFFTEERKSQEEELADLLKGIEKMAAAAGVHLSSINPSGDIEETPLYTRYEINIECMGELEKITRFVYDIGSSDELVKVEMFELTSPSSDADLLKCAMTILKLIVSLPPAL